MEISTFMINLEILISCGQGKYNKVMYNSMEPVLFLINRNKKYRKSKLFSNFSIHNSGYTFCHVLNDHLKFVLQIIAFLLYYMCGI